MHDQIDPIRSSADTAIERMREVASREAECPSSPGLFSTAQYFQHAKDSGALESIGHLDPLAKT